MTINEIYELVDVICNKFQSGAIGPDAVNLLFKKVNLDLFKFYTGLPEQYVPNQPARIAWQVTQKITDTISHLHKPVVIMKGADGYFPFPTNYAAFSSIMIPRVISPADCDPENILVWRRVEQVTEGERAIRLDHGYKKPTLKYPISCFYETGILVDPEEIDRIRLAYLRYPKDAYWNYTVVNDEPVFNPTGSSDFDWPDQVHNDIVIRICNYVGINIREADLFQITERLKTNGT